MARRAITLTALIVLMIAFVAITIIMAENMRRPLDAEEFQSVGTFRAYFLDVGQGDSILLQYPDNRTLLVDGGNRQGGRLAAKHLDSLNITGIDAILTTHPDSDHIGGLETILDTRKVSGFISNCMECSTKTCDSLEGKLKEKGIPVTCANIGDSLMPQKGVQTSVIHARTGLRGNNDNSIVLLISYGDFSMLLMGDCESECEDSIIRARLIHRADVLKVGHHGSKSSTSRRFVLIADPRDAVISVGRNNFGHPADEVIERLGQAIIWRTDQNGSILVETDGYGYTIGRALT